jgi:uncharacterized glyoxalase superfamily protein PhnB
MPVKPRPAGYHSVTPYLVVPRVRELMEFLKRVLGATEGFPPMTDGGMVVHAELRLGDSVVMMAEANDVWTAMPAMLHVYVDEEVDVVYRRAVDAGATSVREPADQFYGERTATVRDVSGNLWSLSNVVEELSVEEVQRRAATTKGSGSAGA